MNQLEYKIVWELETWKKAEEAKFKFVLKQKEIDFLSKLNEEWKAKVLFCFKNLIIIISLASNSNRRDY